MPTGHSGQCKLQKFAISIERKKGRLPVAKFNPMNDILYENFNRT